MSPGKKKTTSFRLSWLRTSVTPARWRKSEENDRKGSKSLVNLALKEEMERVIGKRYRKRWKE